MILKKYFSNFLVSEEIYADGETEKQVRKLHLIYATTYNLVANASVNLCIISNKTH